MSESVEVIRDTEVSAPHPLTNLGENHARHWRDQQRKKLIKSGLSLAEEIIKLIAFLGG